MCILNVNRIGVDEMTSVLPVSDVIIGRQLLDREYSVQLMFLR